MSSRFELIEQSDNVCTIYQFFLLALQPPSALASDFQFRDHFTDGRTPWMSDQLVAGPLYKHKTTQTQNKDIQTPNIHALCGIRTHDPSIRASGYCDRPHLPLDMYISGT
jgi:hypothetical protein